jgi:hypothetical protein
MLAAVAKSQKLRLEPISSPTISVGEESTQSLRITATKGVLESYILTKLMLGDCTSEIKDDVYERWKGYC